MTHTQWTMLSLVSQHQLPGACGRLAAVDRSARWHLTRQSDSGEIATRPFAAAAATGAQAGMGVKSHACVSCEPLR